MTKQTSSGMPQISTAFDGWMTKIKLLQHKETVVNGIVVSDKVLIEFRGTIQPLSPRALALKPEGQRSWEWLQIHVRALWVSLIPGDKITWNTNVYKIMEVNDYRLNGYIEYHAVRDYQAGGEA